MKPKLFIPMCLVVLYLLVSFSLFAQENKEPKKALDAFITATTKAVAGAEITKAIAIYSKNSGSGNGGAVGGGGESGPAEKTQFDVILKSKLASNDKGEFTLNITQEQFKKLPEEFQLKFTI